ncbi:MAG TPA: lantibiotic dehydratase, partial [Pilimelia sp.]|nr:lantibiotic dehydratase [Pilimelia sp.]
MTRPAADPLVELPGTGWHVWRSAVLRGPGFPATGLDLLGAPDCAKVADAHLAGGADRAEFVAAFDAATGQATARLCDIAADPLFREAVTWQSLTSVEALDGLVRTGPAAPRNSRQRQREILVTRYWQRYCGKNDTIGFFGPVCWTRFDTDTDGVLAEPGPDLVRHRVVDLEWRALAGFVDRLAADPAYRPWLPVVRRPHLALDGDRLLRVGAAPQRLAPAALAVLRACDGTRTAAEVADLAVATEGAGLRKAADALLLLEQLGAQGLVRWGPELPLTIDAERRLRAGLAGIGDPALREAALAEFAKLSEARDALAAAAGDPDAVRLAAHRLEREYVAATGGLARHRPGATYAGRGLAYEETVRDLDVVLGEPVLSMLAPALAPLLQAARWLTVAIAEAYEGALRELYDEAVAAAGSPTVPLGELWYLANGVMFSDGPAGQVMAEFVDRWSRLLGLTGLDPGVRRIALNSAELARAVAGVFPADAPGWSAGRLHSPDLHLCADSADAFARGDFTAVLGELHVAWLTCNGGYLTRFHPEPGALRAAVHRDLGDRVLLLYPPDFPEFTARIAFTLDGPDDVRLAYVDAPAPTLDGVLPLAALTVSVVAGRLVARAPDGHTWPLIELFSPFLAALSVDAFKLAAAGPHTPRVSVDRLVVHRETWRTTVGAS